MLTLDQKKEGIKKFANESPCVCFNLRKAARTITQIYDEMFRKIGITATQTSILTSLAKLGPLTINEMAEAMATDRTTLTRNLRPLERDGYIRIQPGQDRRERQTMITEKGKTMVDKTFKVFQEFQTRVNKAVGRDRIEKLCKELSRTVTEIQKA